MKPITDPIVRSFRPDQPGHRRVLYVSYDFPPCANVGVHRTMKFVKYLPDFGWECSVLTVANPSAPLLDEELLKQIPEQTVICRARTFEPSYTVKKAITNHAGDTTRRLSVLQLFKSMIRFASNMVLQPDPQILWRPAALRKGERLLREYRHDVIVATAPPFSSLLLGAALSKRSGLPLVLDYRDEWGISNTYWENKSSGRMTQAIQDRMQRSVIRSADVLLATTPSSAAALGQLRDQFGSRARETYIYNGFDPADFSETVQEGAVKKDYGYGTERFRLAFVGTLWQLNPIGPVVKGLLRLREKSPELLKHLELVFAGRKRSEQQAELDRLESQGFALVNLPFIPHHEALRLMRSADSLLLINADLPHANRIVNAKTFEYMAARRPIFSVAPQGDLTNLVKELPGTILTDPSNPDEIAEKLAFAIERYRCGMRYDRDHWDISRFERRNLTKEFASLLNEVCQKGSSMTAAEHGAVALPTG